MVKRNKLIEEHYKLNYTTLIKKLTYRVPNKSVALAEEVVQEAYARAVKYFPAFEPKINTFEKWFNAILRNATKDCHASESGGGTSKEYDENTEDIRISRDDHKKIHYMKLEIYQIQKTSQRDYQVLSMFFMNGFTSKDISVYMGMTHSNVRQIIFKFKAKINEEDIIP